MKTKFVLLMLAAVLALGMTGCATRHEVRLDALSTQEIAARGSGMTYVLASATTGVKEDELFFKEVARHLNPVLNELGYREAASGAQAQLLIDVDAHLSDPLVETRSYSDPVYVETSGYLRYYRVPVVNDQGRVVRYRQVR